jgi:hypothetical protein
LIAASATFALKDQLSRFLGPAQYYDLSVTNAVTGQQVLHYTSHPNGVNSIMDRGALDIEFDLLVFPYAMASGPPVAVITDNRESRSKASR